MQLIKFLLAITKALQRISPRIFSILPEKKDYLTSKLSVFNLILSCYTKNPRLVGLTVETVLTMLSSNMPAQCCVDVENNCVITPPLKHPWGLHARCLLVWTVYLFPFSCKKVLFISHSLSKNFMYLSFT